MTRKRWGELHRATVAFAAFGLASFCAPAHVTADDGGVELPPALERVQTGLDALTEWANNAKSIRIRWEQKNHVAPSDWLNLENFVPVSTVNHDIQATKGYGIQIIDIVTVAGHGSFQPETEISGMVALRDNDGMAVLETAFIREDTMAFRGNTQDGKTPVSASYAIERPSSLEPVESPGNCLVGMIPRFARPESMLGIRRYRESGLLDIEESDGSVKYSHGMTKERVEYLIGRSTLLNVDIPVSIVYHIGDSFRFEQQLEEIQDGFRLTRIRYEKGLNSSEISASFVTAPEEQRDVRYSSIPPPDLLPEGSSVRIVDSGLVYQVGGDSITLLEDAAFKEIQNATQ